MGPAEIRRLEELSLTGLPALETETFDGWILRAAGGYTGRSNSAIPMAAGNLPLDRKIDHLERWYRLRRLPPMIRLTPCAQPMELDRVLEARGYAHGNGEVSVCRRPLDGEHFPVEAVEITKGRPPPAWLGSLVRFQDRVAVHRDTVRQLFALLPARSAFATVRHDAQPVALGRAVFEDGHVGLFDVFTREDLRGRGFATDVTLALLGWGTSMGATRAWLQVFAANEPALGLYRRLGFVEVYRYWYRVAPG